MRLDRRHAILKDGKNTPDVAFEGCTEAVDVFYDTWVFQCLIEFQFSCKGALHILITKHELFYCNNHPSCPLDRFINCAEAPLANDFSKLVPPTEILLRRKGCQFLGRPATNCSLLVG